jgi:hypothetical protein
MIEAPNLRDLEWLEHGFGLRDSAVPAGVTTVKQVHSSIILDAAELDDAGVAVSARQGDALISDRPGVRVGVKTADCVPILLVDTSSRVVAAIHAGWRGSAENIAGGTVRELAARWSTRPENVRAAIGPAIGVCCYEVGPEVAHRFERWVPVAKNRHLDLPAINEKQLRIEGVVDIWKSGQCTYCMAEKFFSFRREREHAGRMLSFIGLQKHVGRTSQLI